MILEFEVKFEFVVVEPGYCYCWERIRRVLLRPWKFCFTSVELIVEHGSLLISGVVEDVTESF